MGFTKGNTEVNDSTIETAFAILKKELKKMKINTTTTSPDSYC